MRAFEIRVRELDHRLSVGEASPHLIANVGSRSIEFLVKPNDTFGDEVDSFFQPLGRHVEMPTHLGHRTVEQPPRDPRQSCRCHSKRTRKIEPATS